MDANKAAFLACLSVFGPRKAKTEFKHSLKKKKETLLESPLAKRDSTSRFVVSMTRIMCGFAEGRSVSKEE